MDWFTSTGDEIALVAAGFSQFQRINILFTQIATDQFAGYVRNSKGDPTPLPANSARDFFLRNIDLEVFLKGVSDRAQLERQLTQMVYFLNIERVDMALDSEDWDVISRVMFSLIAEAIKSREPTDARSKDQLSKLEQNIGELSEQE